MILRCNASARELFQKSFFHLLGKYFGKRFWVEEVLEEVWTNRSMIDRLSIVTAKKNRPGKPRTGQWFLKRKPNGFILRQQHLRLLRLRN